MKLIKESNGQAFIWTIDRSYPAADQESIGEAALFLFLRMMMKCGLVALRIYIPILNEIRVTQTSLIMLVFLNTKDIMVRYAGLCCAGSHGCSSCGLRAQDDMLMQVDSDLLYLRCARMQFDVGNSARPGRGGIGNTGKLGGKSCCNMAGSASAPALVYSSQCTPLLLRTPVMGGVGGWIRGLCECDNNFLPVLFVADIETCRNEADALRAC